MWPHMTVRPNPLGWEEEMVAQLIENDNRRWHLVGNKIENLSGKKSNDNK